MHTLEKRGRQGEGEALTGSKCEQDSFRCPQRREEIISRIIRTTRSNFVFVSAFALLLLLVCISNFSPAFPLFFPSALWFSSSFLGCRFSSGFPVGRGSGSGKEVVMGSHPFGTTAENIDSAGAPQKLWLKQWQTQLRLKPRLGLGMHLTAASAH